MGRKSRLVVEVSRRDVYNFVFYDYLFIIIIFIYRTKNI